MSITKQVTVWCDTCGDWDQASYTTIALRKELRGRGWTREGQSDYCKTCSLKRKETKGSAATKDNED